MRIGIIAASAAFALAVAACDAPEAPVLEVRDVIVYAPLPATGVAVGYLTLANRTENDVVIRGARSPQFAQVEFHRTDTKDNVARMLATPSIVVPAGGELRLQPGGHHLMLIDPIAATSPNDDVVIAFDSTAGEIIVRTAVQSRTR